MASKQNPESANKDNEHRIKNDPVQNTGEKTENPSKDIDSVERETHEHDRHYDPIQHFQELLLNSMIDKAIDWQSRLHLQFEEIIPIVEHAFNTLKKSENFSAAIQIGVQWHLEPNVIFPLYVSEWNRLIKQEKFEEAAEWGYKYGLSDVEITRSAKMAFEVFIKKGLLDDAFRMVYTYKLKNEDILGFTIEAFNKAYNEGDFIKAARLGKEFNLSEKRTYTAAIYAVFETLNEKDIEGMLKIFEDFKLLTDDVFSVVQVQDTEKFLRDLYNEFVKPGFSKGNFSQLHQFAELTDILTLEYNNEMLRKFYNKFLTIATSAHNNSLTLDDTKSSKYIRDAFKLNSVNLSGKLYYSIIEEALLYHKKLLKNRMLKQAIDFKNDYELFKGNRLKGSLEEARREVSVFVVSAIDSGDFRSAKLAIKEYDIPSKIVEESLFSGISRLVKKYKYKDAFKVINEFKLKITDKYSQSKCIGIFRDLLGVKEYLLAADFAEKLKLGKHYRDEAALKAWKEMFRDEKFDKAFDIKKRFKIPKRETLPLAKEAYWKYMDNKEYDLAISIRRSYRIPLSFSQWLTELIKLFFKN